mmetsp:Transcript_2046/g.3618  ORF Transcript_2046/g.3618 Transcript_2046/m.3618 type:complete len:180 (-) Transcript_2046:52-591(-)
MQRQMSLESTTVSALRELISYHLHWQLRDVQFKFDDQRSFMIDKNKAKMLKEIEGVRDGSTVHVSKVEVPLPSRLQQDKKVLEWVQDPLAKSFIKMQMEEIEDLKKKIELLKEGKTDALMQDLEHKIEILKGDVAFHKDDKVDLEKMVELYEQEMRECDKMHKCTHHSDKRLNGACVIF